MAALPRNWGGCPQNEEGVLCYGGHSFKMGGFL